METNTAVQVTKKSRSRAAPTKKVAVEPEEMMVDVHTSKKKKSSKEKHHKKSKKSNKMEIDTPQQQLPAKKRKAVEIATSTPEKKTLDVHTPEKTQQWLEMLNLRGDLKQLQTLKTHQPDRFSKLLSLMNDTPKGFIYSYLVKTPLGRMFWFDAKEDKFKSVRDDLNLIRLRDYDKENSLNIFATVHALSTPQRTEVFEFLGITEAESATVNAEQWLFALIETNIIIQKPDKPDYTQCVEPCLLHDVAARQTFWLSSVGGKFRLRTVIVSRARQITAKNIDAEYVILSAKRLEIAAYLKKVTSSSSASKELNTPPKKKKKKEKAEPVEEVLVQPVEKKKRTAQPAKVKVLSKEKAAKVAALEKQEQELLEQQRLKENMSAVLHQKLAELEEAESDKSTPTSESESYSFTDEEDAKGPKIPPKAALLEDARNKQILTQTPKVPAPNAKSIEMNKIMEEARRSFKFLNAQVNPKIDYFRANCGPGTNTTATTTTTPIAAAATVAQG